MPRLMLKPRPCQPRNVQFRDRWRVSSPLTPHGVRRVHRSIVAPELGPQPVLAIGEDIRYRTPRSASGHLEWLDRGCAVLLEVLDAPEVGPLSSWPTLAPATSPSPAPAAGRSPAGSAAPPVAACSSLTPAHQPPEVDRRPRLPSRARITCRVSIR